MSPRVVVGVDGSPASREAALWAAHAAGLRGERLHLVHAFAWPAPAHYFGGELTGPIAEPYGEELRKSAEAMLSALAETIRGAAPLAVVTSELVLGTTAHALLELSRTATMVVVGSRGLGGFAGLLVGSVGTQLAAHAYCPVTVVHGPVATPAGRVVVGVDPPAESDAALEFAFDEAARRSAELTVAHAWTSSPIASDAPRALDTDAAAAAQSDRLTDRLAPWGEKYPGVAVHADAQEGRPADVLLAAADGADLLVVGSHGHGTLHDLVLGSVANTVLHSARCPVAIVPTRRRQPAPGA